MENDFLINGTVFVNPTYLYIVCANISILSAKWNSFSFLRAFYGIGYDVNICI